MLARGLALATLLLFDGVRHTQSKPDVHVLGTYPLDGSWNGGTAFAPAIEFALEELNDPTLAPDRPYNFNMTWINDKCSSSGLMKSMVPELIAGNYIGLISSACSGATSAAAELGPVWHVFPLSNGAGSPGLTHRDTYPYHIRTSLSEGRIILSTLNVLLKLDVKRFGILIEPDEPLSRSLVDTLRNHIVAENIDVAVLLVASFQRKSHAEHQVRNLMRNDARYIINTMYSPATQHVLCQCHKLGWSPSPYHTMLIHGFFSATFYKADPVTNKFGAVDCTVEELRASTMNALGGGESPLGSDSNPHSITGELPSAWVHRYIAATVARGLGNNVYAWYTYDSMYLMARALDIYFAKHPDKLVYIPEWREEKAHMEELYQILQTDDVQFYGVTGRLSFTEGTAAKNPDRVGIQMHYRQLRPSAATDDSSDLRWTIVLKVAGDGSLSLQEKLCWSSDCSQNLNPSSLVNGTFSLDRQFVPPDAMPACGVDYYLDTPISCKPCDVGFGNQDPKATSCQRICAQGKQLVDGQCQVCPVGQAGILNASGKPRCATCGEGYFAASVGRSACHQCSKGFFSEVAGRSRCTECVAGRYQSNRGRTTCELCLAGHFSADFGNTDCQACPVGRYSDSNSSSMCRDCGGTDHATFRRIAGTWALHVGAASISSCGCKEGRQPIENACVSCGEGLQCIGKGEVVVDPGFASDGQLSTFKCYADSARCPGGVKEQRCALGRRGIQCSECKAGMRPADDGTCAACDGSDLIPFCICIVVVIAILVGTYYIVDTENLAGLMHSQLLVAIAMGQLIAISQLLGVINRLWIEFPEPLKSFLTAISLFVFEIEILRLNCVTQTPPVTLFSLKVTSILVLSAVILVIHAFFVMLRHSGKFKSRFSTLFAIFGTVFTVCYISVTSALLAPLQCEEHPNGKWTVRNYGSVICWESDTHMTMIIAAMISMLFPLGYICTCVKLVLQYPAQMRAMHTTYLHRYSFLFVRLRPESYWYGLVIMGRSLIFAVVPVIPSAPAQLFLLQMSMISLLIITVWIHPWRVKVSNHHDIFSNATIVLFLSLSSLFARTEPVDRTAVALVCLVGISCVFLTLAAAIPYGWMKAIVRHSKLYKFFLCHHKAGCGAYTRMLKLFLVEQPKLQTKVFVDCDDLSDLDTLFDTVGSEVENLVVIASCLIFTRPWCVGEITTAWTKDVKIKIVQLPEFGGLDDCLINAINSQMKDMCVLASSGISTEMVISALQFIKDLPKITVPLIISNAVVHALATKLVDGDGSGFITIMESDSTSFGTSHSSVIICDTTIMEASAAALVLAKLLVADHVNVAVDYRPGAELEKVIVLFSTGCLDRPHLPSMLMEIARREPQVLPVMIEEGFRPPSPQKLEELRHRSPVSDLEAEPGTLAAIVELVFHQIAIEYPVSMASEEVLKTITKHIAMRLAHKRTTTFKDKSGSSLDLSAKVDQCVMTRIKLSHVRQRIDTEDSGYVSWCQSAQSARSSAPSCRTEEQLEHIFGTTTTKSENELSFECGFDLDSICANASEFIDYAENVSIAQEHEGSPTHLMHMIAPPQVYDVSAFNEVKVLSI